MWVSKVRNKTQEHNTMSSVSAMLVCDIFLQCYRSNTGCVDLLIMTQRARFSSLRCDSDCTYCWPTFLFWRLWFRLTLHLSRILYLWKSCWELVMLGIRINNKYWWGWQEIISCTLARHPKLIYHIECLHRVKMCMCMCV